MKKQFKNYLSIIMTLCLLGTNFAGWNISAFAADNVSVKIVSFIRGEQSDLRSSELLEARVEGYSGNVRELTYEWTNEIGTYLYVYNNHNMYGIDGTDGEIEIYNDDVESSANMSGRSYNKTYEGKGFAWAAIYGANYSNSDLLGTITVKVKDEDGNVIATDTHTGTRVGRWGRYTYSGFVTDNLNSDLQSIAFGIFEGDSKHIKELFSESSIVHITCSTSSVSEAEITSGSSYISLNTGEEGHYIVEALKPGKSEITMTIKKENCKFHQYSEGESKTTVYVYKRPVPTPTTTTITLSNLDEHCTYYIDGKQGRKQSDGTIIFEGLTPNTTYTIEAQGQAEGTEVVYAYTHATTLPVFNGTVMVYLDGGYDTATATAYGTLINIDTIRETENDLYVKNINGGEFVELVNTSTGVYTAGLSNGTYYIYRDAKEESKISDQHLDIDNSDRTRYLFYYSVSYDANGGSGEPATEYYYKSSHVTVSETVPTKEGYDFIGWKDADGNIYQPGAVLANDIEEAHKLTAQWEESIKANVNLKVIFNHQGATAIDPEPTGTLTVDLAYRADETEPYVEVVGKEASYTDWYTAGTKEGNVTTTVYPSIFTDLSGKYEYSANVFLDQYQVVDSDVVKTEDSEGNATYDVTVYLQYNPDLFNLTYNVVADKSVPDELIPQAADIKILIWDVNEENKWAPISRHKDYSVDVAFDSTDHRHGSGSYGVPVHNDGETNYYRVDATGLTLADGTEILFTTTDGVNYYSIATAGLAQGAYSAVVSVEGGKDVDNTDLDGSYGVYITDSYKQQGEITVTVYVNRYDVIFNSNGGSAVETIEDRFTIPDVSSFIPVKANHTFMGWYTDASLTTPVETGAVMSEDITLYAKWEENLTVKGTVSVAGTYELEERSTHTILDSDRIKTVRVLLQRIDANGYPVTIESKDVSITYSDDMGTGQYEFTNIQNDGHSYRIKAIEENYGESYQNELSSSTVVTDYEVYDNNHYKAEFNGDTTAVVNAYLPFNPVVFDLNYKIDATAIAEGFRPEGVETLVLCDEGISGTTPQHWAVITQMIINGTAKGQDTVLTAGIGEDSYPVWEGNPSKLYDYAIRVDKYTSAGSETKYDEIAAPFRIYYNGSARYSAVNGQTQLLTAALVPKMYTITFDVNAGEDAVLNMDSYLTVSGAYQDTYYWSFGKSITARPLRTGYKFLGWFDANGNKVTEIAPDMAEDITVTAKWEELNVEQYISDYAYIFGYNNTTMGAEGPLLRCEVSAMVHRLVKQNNKLGDFVYNSADPSFADIAGEWFQSGIEYAHHEGSFTAPEGGNVQPYVQITRGEAFKIVALGLEFTEDTTLSNQAYAELLFELGYLVGDDDGNLNADSLITRAEFCTLYNRIIGRSNALLEDKNGNEITAETYGFTDLSKDKWYYVDMVRATSAYDENGFVDISLRGIRNDLDDFNG